MFHLFLSNFVVRVGGEAWIVHMLYLCSVEGEAEQNTIEGLRTTGGQPKIKYWKLHELHRDEKMTQHPRT